MTDEAVLNAITPWEQVTIANGLMFRLVMNKPDICKKLLERLLDIKIKHIEVPDFEKDFRVNGTSKGIRTDVYIEDMDGTAVIVELQAMNLNREMLGRRSRYYQGITDVARLPKGWTYATLPKSYIIFICTFDPYGQGRSKYTFSNLCHEDKQLAMADDAYKIFFNAKGSMKGITKAQQNFLEYVQNGHISDDFTQELDEAVKEMKFSDRKRGIYMIWSQELLLQKEEGLKEGLKEGRKEGFLQAFISMVKKNKMTKEEAALEAGVSVAELEKAMLSLS